MNLKENNKKLFSILLISSIIFFILCISLIYFSNFEFAPHFSNRLVIAAISAVIYATILLIPIKSFESIPLYGFIAFAIISSFILLVRIPLFDIMSGDYVSFLSEWGVELKKYSGIDGLAQNIGNYNIPYMVILWLISKFQTADLYLIKLVSIAFDVMLAYYSMKLLQLKTKNVFSNLLLFSVIMILPTVLTNSSWWAQCDSIFTAFGLAGLYYACISKGKKSIIMFTLSFCFKLQGAFLFPLIPIFMILRKIKLKDLIMAPVTYFISILPALIAGRNFYNVFTIYFNQFDTYDSLTLSCPNIYTFFNDIYDKRITLSGMVLAGLFVLSLFIFLVFKNNKLDNEKIIFAALLLQFGLIMLLPRMHERYS